MNRRLLIKALGLVPLAACTNQLDAKEKSTVPSKLNKEDWKKILPAENYRVLFEEATERAGTSPLNKEKREGVFVCAACYNPLFDSDKKFESGTGWPSFWQPRPEAIAKKRDFLMIVPRTEYHCAHCGGHQGHVFDDGPKPTGLRYCNNGVALRFVPKEEPLPALRA